MSGVVFAVGAIDVHPDRADPEPGDLKIPPWPDCHGFGYGKLYGRRFSRPDVTVGGAAVCSAASNGRLLWDGLYYRDEGRGGRLAPAKAGGAGGNHGALHRSATCDARRGRRYG